MLSDRWRRMLPLLILVALVWWFVRVANRPQDAPSLIGQQAPPLQTETFTGAPLDLHSLRGQGVLLNFWASWCGPCRAEAAILEQAWSALKAPATQATRRCPPLGACNKNISNAAPEWIQLADTAPATQPEIIFIGIAHQDTVAGSRQFLETYGITYPNAPDLDGQWATRFGVAGLPETFFIDPDGVVQSQVRGPLLNASDLQKRLAQIRPSAHP